MHIQRRLFEILGIRIRITNRITKSVLVHGLCSNHIAGHHNRRGDVTRALEQLQ